MNFPSGRLKPSRGTESTNYRRESRSNLSGMPKSIKRIHLLSHLPSSPSSLPSIHLENSFNRNETRVREFIRILRSRFLENISRHLCQLFDRVGIHISRVFFFSEGHRRTCGINPRSTCRGDDKRDDRLTRKVACVSIL